VFVFAGVPDNAAKAIRIASDLGWFLLNDTAASIATGLKPAGLEKSIGVISATFMKDVHDPAWKDDPAIANWKAFKDNYYHGDEKDDGAALSGYAAAETLAQVLKQCGDDLSRENVMRQAAALENCQLSLLLPDIKVSTGPLGLPADQATAAGAVRRPDLATDRRRDRGRVLRWQEISARNNAGNFLNIRSRKFHGSSRNNSAGSFVVPTSERRNT
jgi:hypothetical protein